MATTIQLNSVEKRYGAHDVIRGIDVADDEQQPVVLIASPYLWLESPDETPGPSNRFFDVIDWLDRSGPAFFDELRAGQSPAAK